MFKGTDVMINDSNGIIITMDFEDTKFFLESISISTISLCRDIKFNKHINSILLKTESSSSNYDKLVNDYCCGGHLMLLNTNVRFLYNFIKGCVINKTSNEFLAAKSMSLNKCIQLWRLVIMAIDEYIDLNKRMFESINEPVPADILQYSKYNEEFIKMIEKAWKVWRR